MSDPKAPIRPVVLGHGEHIVHRGLSIRDHFAIEAAKSLITKAVGGISAVHIADQAYTIADELIVRSEQK